MFTSTMTYEEIYQAISDEMHDVYDHYEKVVKPKMDRFLKTRNRFPARMSIEWQHPNTHNTYHYYVQSNRKAQWKNPFMSILCEYERNYGKELLIVIPNLQKKELLLHVFTSHFYKRYGERFMNGETDYYRIVSQYLIRNTKSASMGKECVSLREQQEEVPGYDKEAMLTLDGLGLGLRSKNRNIIIYKTFISFDKLHDSQFHKVWPIFLYFVCGLAIESSPKNKLIINDIYEAGAREIHQLGDDNSITKEEKCKLVDKVYGQTYIELAKYIP